jgi:hypothetical protein
MFLQEHCGKVQKYFGQVVDFSRGEKAVAAKAMG